MGRRRRKDLHLPKRMYERRGKYYFDSPVTGKWEPLGDDYLAALAKYGTMTGAVKNCRTLSDVFRRYKIEVTPLPLKGRPRTKDGITNEHRTLDRFDRVFGHMMQDSLTQKMLYEYIDKRVDEREEFKDLNKPAPAAGRKDVRFLKKVLRKGIKWAAGTTNAALNLEYDPDNVDDRNVTDEEFAIVYKAANVRIQIAMDLADIIGQRRGDILGIKLNRDITPDGILVRQGKTGKPILLEWTDALRAVYERALALKPDIPKEYVLRTRAGRRYTPDGFGSMWQRLMNKMVASGKLAQRFKFKNLRRKAATAKAAQTSVEEAQDLLAHSSSKTTKKHYIDPSVLKPKRVKPVR